MTKKYSGNIISKKIIVVEMNEDMAILTFNL